MTILGRGIFALEEQLETGFVSRIGFFDGKRGGVERHGVVDTCREHARHGTADDDIRLDDVIKRGNVERIRMVRRLGNLVPIDGHVADCGAVFGEAYHHVVRAVRLRDDVDLVAEILADHLLDHGGHRTLGIVCNVDRICLANLQIVLLLLALARERHGGCAVATGILRQGDCRHHARGQRGRQHQRSSATNNAVSHFLFHSAVPFIFQRRPNAIANHQFGVLIYLRQTVGFFELLSQVY